MKITLKLFASLAARLPPDAQASRGVQIEVPSGSTVLDVIRRQRIPESLCAIVLVDGNWVGRPERASRELRDGTVLAIWPPIAGGAPAFTRSFEMGVTRGEFLRLLRGAVPWFEVSEEETGAASGCGRTMIRWIDRDGRGAIRLVALPDRPVAQGSSLAAFRLPRHRVEITLEQCTEAGCEAFMARFHRAFLRGGG